MPHLEEVRRLDRRIRVTVSGILILILFLNTIPLTSAGENKSERDYVTYVTIENYSPGDFTLNITDNNGNDLGSLTRGWIENTYEDVVIENFIDTRQVLDHYEYEPSYTVWSYGTPIRDDTPLDDELHWDLNLSDWEIQDIDRSTRFWLHTYIKKLHRHWYRFLTEEVEPNRFQEFNNGWQRFQKFYNWGSTYIDYESGTQGFYSIPIPYHMNYLVKNGEYKIPVYRGEEYTRWRTTTYQINDWTPENWPQLQTQITLTGINGYDENVHLTVETDNELLNTSLEDQVVHVGSIATTKLTITPDRRLHGSIHQITVTATDQYSREKQATYQLDLQTTSKPPVENQVIDVTVTDKKPDQGSGDGGRDPDLRLGVAGDITGDGGPGVSNPGTDVVERYESVSGNSYRSVDEGMLTHETQTFHVWAKAPGYMKDDGYATDYANTYEIANLDFDLEPYSP
ncbi:hypothetical protein AKJ47_00675 [candidate division MSBL1 archaeon SCGC-AAA261G05]|uniref:Uncharacterized protein n=2 Tax=candidate division MSBL1 TaxID=215777 RepID=A0A133V1U1_9EURY|nr:hypothetical protein AKJ42_00850 [candidate division MSBL1 archaeon SCGC-AAA261C02]KXB04094.1 hypothetical protein AKJ47_00675 [candidate division MSBL1 archaeon SCGC-AAA261G05]